MSCYCRKSGIMKWNTIMIMLIGMLFVITTLNGQQAAVSQDTTGTSSTTAQSTPSTPSPNKAVIYVYREGSIVGAANYPILYVNDVFLAKLHNSNYATCEMEPGTAVFSYLPRQREPFDPLGTLKLLKKSTILTIQLEAGKTYYFKWSYGGFTDHLLKLVDAERGSKEMSKLHLAKD